MIKGLLFDLDGTLVNTKEANYLSYKEAYMTIGINLSRVDYSKVFGLRFDDMAEASLFVLELDEQTYKANTQSMLSHINVGTGKDVTIREMAETMKKVVEYKGNLAFDTAKSDGSPRKLIDVSRLSNMGWKYGMDLEEGLRKTYKWYKNIFL